MPARPLVLVHGYSASGAAFDTWKSVLHAHGYRPRDLHVCTYESLTNEVTIKDLAEAFDRALRIQTGLNDEEEFDAIVHSTGMLVVRSWLASHPRRKGRLKHLVGLAPATFGSPLAHKGRGWLGAVFRGNRELGPDFMEAGDAILDGLELGSRFTWELAHRDLVSGEPFYGPHDDTPYAFIFCGTSKYPFPLNLISEDGSDGTVRISGAALNTRKVLIDLTLDRSRSSEVRRVQTAPWSNVDIPVIPIAKRDHSSIMSRPPAELVRMVLDALSVTDADAYGAWRERAERHSRRVLAGQKDLARWQQLLVRVVDERGDGVSDWYLDFIAKPVRGRKWRRVRHHRMAVRPYSGDPSYRCFHIDIDSLGLDEGDSLGVRLIASSGSALVGYHGYSDGNMKVLGEAVRVQGQGEVPGAWSGVIDLSTLEQISFFYPFTTTLIEIRLNREPQPLEGRNDVLWFDSTPETRQALAAEALARAPLKHEQQQRLLALFEETTADQG